MVLLVGLLLAALHLIRFFLLPSYELDDAWISFRIARNLLEHGILSYDIHTAPVEGMTNLSWTLLSTVWIGLAPGLDPILPARLLGVLCHLGAVVLMALTTLRLVGKQDERTGMIAVGVTLLILATSGSLAFHSVSGMETGFWALLIALALYTHVVSQAGSHRVLWLLGLLLGLQVFTRPEGVLFAGLLILLQLIRQGWYRTIPVVVPVFVSLVAVQLFRWQYYGDVLPNTFYAKPPDSSGLEYATNYLLWGLAVVGPLGLYPVLRKASLARGYAAIALILFIGIVATGGDWMAGFRRLTPTVLIVAMLFGCSVAYADVRMRRWILGVAAILVATQLFATATHKDSSMYITYVHRDLGDLAELTPDITDVAMNDIGRFGYAFTGRIFDLAGLTDRHIARQKGTHMQKAWDEAYFRERSPELILMIAENDVRGPVPRMPIVQSSEWDLMDSLHRNGGYSFHASLPIGVKEGHILIFSRDDIVLPVHQWGEPANIAPVTEWMR